MSECDLKISESLHAADTSVWELKVSNTGRTVRGTEGYQLAMEWTQAQDRISLLKHPAADEFFSLISNAPNVSATHLLCFRGRCFTTEKPCAHQMGPPPPNNTTEGGRYNCPGEHVLYLSDSEEGLRRELDYWCCEGVPYVQRYQLPIDKLRIADFTKIPSDHFVCAVFSFAEECEVKGRSLKGYLFSQTIAELIAALFDGMRVPGVRGEPGIWYSNIIIFRPFPDWPYWIDPSVAPYRLC